jgi:Flp pilus assembly protein TadG
MRRNGKKSRIRERGAVLVEMALVTPILLLVMLATAEITRAFIDHNTLTKAVRNGVRHVASRALLGSTGIVFLNAALQTEAKNLVVYGNTAGTGTPVLPGLAPANVTITDLGANNIEITASYAISGILGPVLPAFYGPGANMNHNLQATVSMRAL